MSNQSDLIAVKRDGPRGWHWIARSDYDPAIHKAHQAGPLGRDADGKKGGSLSGEHVHVPADYEVDNLPPPSAKARPRPRKKG